MQISEENGLVTPSNHPQKLECCMVGDPHSKQNVGPPQLHVSDSKLHMLLIFKHVLSKNRAIL